VRHCAERCGEPNLIGADVQKETSNKGNQVTTVQEISGGTDRRQDHRLASSPRSSRPDSKTEREKVWRMTVQVEILLKCFACGRVYCEREVILTGKENQTEDDAIADAVADRHALLGQFKNDRSWSIHYCADKTSGFARFAGIRRT
jgi:hypothetical protein